MIKNNKLKLFISSIVILLPIVFGLVFWNKLPEQMTTHWGFDGNPDGFSNRFFAVFALPLVMLIAQWLCVFFTTLDSKNKEQNNKVFSLVIWIIPIISLFANGIVYAVSFGKEFSPQLITILLMGLTFIVIGNYMPKCKQNYTIGIRVKWTLENEENWNVTHRICGKIWVIGGLVLLACMFLPNFLMYWVVFSIILILVIIPIIYSYCYYKKQVREGKEDMTPFPKSKTNKIIIIVSLVVFVLISIFIVFWLFSGDIDVKYNEESFTIEADYWSDLTIKYNAIDNIEYRETDNNKGLRTYGLGSARLLAGAFYNEEFGNYTRYSYTNCDACIVLKVDEKILVVSGLDAESTKIIYEKIKSNI